MNITSPFSASADTVPMPNLELDVAQTPLPEVVVQDGATDPHNNVMTLLHRAGQTGAVKTLRGSLGRYANRLPSRGL